MSYHCGVDRGTARVLKCESGPPRIVCDSCGLIYPIEPRGAGACPPMWFINDKSPPRWRKRIGADGERRDLCPRCKTEEP